MFPQSSDPKRQLLDARRRRPCARAGMTILELLIGISIMVMIVGSLGALASAIRSSADYGSTRATAIEHARVILERINRMVGEATANRKFPGFVVLADSVGGYRYPETLVIWHPDPQVLAANPSRARLDDPNRLPYYDELIVICPNPSAPNQLVEIRSTSNTQLNSSAANWPADIALFKTSMVLDTNVLSGGNPGSATYQAVTLTGLLRKCPLSSSSSVFRGAIRFESRLRPSDEDWNNTGIAWSALPWVQGVFSPTTGLRQAWLRTELQLVPESTATGTTGARQVMPFVGSAALYYSMRKDPRP